MTFSSKRVLAILLGAALLSIAAKLFLVQISYRDDPTTSLSIRTRPSWRSYEIKSPETKLLRDLIVDENSYIGESVFAVFAKGGWVVFPLLFIICLFL